MNNALSKRIILIGSHNRLNGHDNDCKTNENQINKKNKLCDVFTCHTKFLKYDPSWRQKKKKLKHWYPNSQARIFFIFYFFQFCDIIKISIIHKKIYTNFLSLSIFRYLLKSNDEIWLFKKMIENIKICWLRAIFSKKKSFKCVEISISKTGRNCAEVQKIKRKQYIANIPIFS